MSCSTGRMGNDFVTICFPDVFRILAGDGAVYQFEYHHFCGPTLLLADGFTPFDEPLEEDHPFWNALTAWIENGRRVDQETGFAITEARTDDTAS